MDQILGSRPSFTNGQSNTTTVSVTTHVDCNTIIPCDTSVLMDLRRTVFKRAALANIEYASQYLLTSTNPDCLPPIGGWVWTSTGVTCETAANPPAEDANLVQITGIAGISSSSVCTALSSDGGCPDTGITPNDGDVVTGLPRPPGRIPPTPPPG